MISHVNDKVNKWESRECYIEERQVGQQMSLGLFYNASSFIALLRLLARWFAHS